ncbi:MAG: SAM-dependent chlorinase/fluorinase [Candidatus Aureabacteria bacterium]|nr:SAM-dependent chlorinase/fluorinase [Candidatus Auribacterota bacterium]
MNTIALLTDFGLVDPYAAMIKAVIWSINPCVSIIDLSHHIHPQQIREGAFILWRSYRYFPRGTIFLCVVDPGVGSNRNAVAVKTNRYIFIGPDNGLLSPSAEEDGIREIIRLEDNKYFLKNVSSTFHGRDIFAPAAAHLSKGIKIRDLGRRITAIHKVDIPKPKKTKNQMILEILYTDHFGNLVTNLTKKEFQKFSEKRKWRVKAGSKIVEHFSDCYEDAPSHTPFLIEGSLGFLEIAVKNASAKSYFGFERDNFLLKFTAS